MAKSFNNVVKRLDKGVSRSLGRYNRGGNQRNTRTYDDKPDWKKGVQCRECEGYGHLQRECPLFKRKEMKCAECKCMEHLKTECPNLEKKNGDKSLSCFSDTESEDEDDNKDLLLNFVVLVDSEKITF